MPVIDLSVSALGIREVILDLNATQDQTERALKSTLVRVAAWLKTRSVRGLSKELKIQQKLIRRRLKSFRLRKTANGQSITVWYGLDQIAMIYLGARQTAKGVTAGAYKADGAFIAKGANGNRQVFKRKGSERLPIQKQTVPIQERAQTWLEDKLIGAAEFEAQFLKIFERELKWRTR